MKHVRIHVYTIHGNPREFVVNADSYGGPLLPVEDGFVVFRRTDTGRKHWLGSIPQAEITGISL